MSRVLIAESHDAMRRLLLVSFGAGDIEAQGARDGDELRRRLEQSHEADVVVCEAQLPGWSGLTALKWLSEHRPAVRVILLTTLGSPRTRQRARELGSLAVYEKPFDIVELRDLVQDLLGSSGAEASDQPR